MTKWVDFFVIVEFGENHQGKKREKILIKIFKEI